MGDLSVFSNFKLVFDLFVIPLVFVRVILGCYSFYKVAKNNANSVFVSIPFLFDS